MKQNNTVAAEERWEEVLGWEEKLTLIDQRKSKPAVAAVWSGDASRKIESFSMGSPGSLTQRGTTTH